MPRSIPRSPLSPTSCCSPGSPPRSAGRRCTTGCPTPTPRRRPPSRHSSLPLSCRPSCSSRGGRSRRSHRRSASARPAACSSASVSSRSRVAVPFLWRSQAWKRLLAYSSLEHMGVIALGIGFGGPLALAGVAIHIVGHAVAKALGFYAATPLLGHDPRASGHAVGGIGRTQPALGASLGISLGALAGLPPSPLFVSEVLIVAGGFQVGRPWAAGAAAILLALGFLGLAHSLIDTVIGKPRGAIATPRPGFGRSRRLPRSPCRCCSLSPQQRSGFRTRRSSTVSCEGSDERRSSTPARLPRRDRVGARGRLAVREPPRDCRRRKPRRAHSAHLARGELRIESVDASRAASVPTIVDIAPAAGWDEREAHDLYGIGFDGHEPLRPLVDHDVPLGRFATPVRGADPYQVAVGPIHAGVIESGHFRFHVVGDLILHVDARLFYKHRGLERAAEGLPLADGLPRRRTLLRRLLGDERRRLCAGVRGATRPRADARARTRPNDPARARARLEHAQRHRRDLRRASVSLPAPIDSQPSWTMRGGSTPALTGHRFLFGSVAVGGSALDLDDATVRGRPRRPRPDPRASRHGRGTPALQRLVHGPYARHRHRRRSRRCARSGSSARRRRAAGRCRGCPHDEPSPCLRGFRAGSAPPTRGRRAGPTRATSARAASVPRHPRPAPAGPVRPAAAAAGGRDRRSASAGSRAHAAQRRASSSATATGSAASASAPAPTRTGLRVAHAAATNLLPDFPLINKSFELCYACVDR